MIHHPEPLKSERLNTSPLPIEPPRTKNKRTGALLLSSNDNKPFSPDEVPNLLPGCIDIVKRWEITFKTEFERIYRINDVEFTARWSERDRRLQGLKTRFINSGYHEKVIPLFEELSNYIDRFNLVLDCLERYKSGKYFLRLRYPSGKPAAYFEHQEVILVD